MIEQVKIQGVWCCLHEIGMSHLTVGIAGQIKLINKVWVEGYRTIQPFNLYAKSEISGKGSKG